MATIGKDEGESKGNYVYIQNFHFLLEELIKVFSLTDIVSYQEDNLPLFESIRDKEIIY